MKHLRIPSVLYKKKYNKAYAFTGVEMQHQLKSNEACNMNSY
jgi:hypothetical protein